jgi:surfeit locus 1 family protein
MTERRRPFWLPTVAALAVVALTVSAGMWQTHRAQYKRALQARYDAQAKAAPIALPSGPFNPDDFRYRRVTATGRFDSAHEIFLDNRMLDGKPGYHVVTPLKLQDGTAYVLIDRGWVIRNRDRTLLPEVKTPLGLVTIEGIAVPPSGKYFELAANAVEGKVWENLHFNRMQKQLPLPLQPLMVAQLNDNGDGLTRHWDRPDVGVEMHVGYAFQWFSLAAATLVIYGVLYARRRKPQQD